jgi:hypothetical protein
VKHATICAVVHADGCKEAEKYKIITWQKSRDMNTYDHNLHKQYFHFLPAIVVVVVVEQNIFFSVIQCRFTRDMNTSDRIYVGAKNFILNAINHKALISLSWVDVSCASAREREREHCKMAQGK